MEQPALQLQNAAFGYPGGPRILRDITLTLPAGTLTFLTGAAGTGKTTLLGLCHGRHRVLRGEVVLLGTALGRQPPPQQLRRRIGVIAEKPHVLEHLSTLDNAALPLRLAGRRRTSYVKDILELLTWAGLMEKVDMPAASLSARERQRLVIARALAGKPDLLLADEPFAGLDDEPGQRMVRLLLNIHRFGTTVLITTGNRNAIPASGAAELRLSNGGIVEPRLAA